MSSGNMGSGSAARPATPVSLTERWHTPHLSEPLPEARVPAAGSWGPVKAGRHSPWQHWVASQPRYGGGTKASVVSGLRGFYTGAL